MPDGTCSIDGCDKPVKVKARGWCGMHYMRWHTHGDPLILATKVRGDCAVEGCGRPSEARGWCQGHHARWKKTGDVQGDVPIRGRSPRPCSVQDCSEPHSAKGLCRLHYSRLQKTGTTNDPVKRSATCAIEGCGRAYFCRGLCKHHYGKAKSKAWRAENPGRDVASHREWRKRNPELARERARLLRARRRAQEAGVEQERVDYAVVLKLHGRWCHICDSEIAPEGELHMDHVIPIARGGSHTYRNVRPSHAKCNRWKGARLLSELEGLPIPA